MAWISFGALLCKKKTWWELASPCCWNRARRLTCFLSASVTRKDLNSAHEQTPLSNDTIDFVLRHRKVGRAENLTATPPSHINISAYNFHVPCVFPDPSCLLKAEACKKMLHSKGCSFFDWKPRENYWSFTVLKIGTGCSVARKPHADDCRHLLQCCCLDKIKEINTLYIDLRWVSVIISNTRINVALFDIKRAL